MLEEVNRLFAGAPFITEIGIQLESAGHGECSTGLQLEPRHLQQDGFVHAGVQATMADHTAGAAAASLLREGQYVLSSGFQIALLRAARGERLLCRSKVLKGGARLTVAESEVFCVKDGEETLTAKATVTLAVLTRKPG